MAVKLPSLITVAAILALAPTAQASEPVTLDDDQLDEIIASAALAEYAAIFLVHSHNSGDFAPETWTAAQVQPGTRIDGLAVATD